MEEFRKSLQTEMFHNKDHSSRPDNRKRPGQPLPADGIQNKKQNKELVTAESDGEEVKPENYFFTKDL